MTSHDIYHLVASGVHRHRNIATEFETWGRSLKWIVCHPNLQTQTHDCNAADLDITHFAITQINFDYTMQNLFCQCTSFIVEVESKLCIFLETPAHFHCSRAVVSIILSGATCIFWFRSLHLWTCTAELSQHLHTHVPSYPPFSNPSNNQTTRWSHQRLTVSP